MIRAFALAAILAAGPALAADPGADALVATGSDVAPPMPTTTERLGAARVARPEAAVPMTTDEKIANLLAGARATDAARDGSAQMSGPRQIHGEVAAAVGSHGYRAGSVSAVIPVGATGTLGLAYARSEGDRLDS